MKETIEIENAKITTTLIGLEDHGIFSIAINFEGEGWGQGTGCYYASGDVERWIKGVIDVLGVQSWESLPNKLVRVKRQDGLLIAVGDIFKDKWFYFKK